MDYAALWLIPTPGNASNSIAILPFENASGLAMTSWAPIRVPIIWRSGPGKPRGNVPNYMRPTWWTKVKIEVFAAIGPPTF